jgi:ribosomal protein L23
MDRGKYNVIVNLNVLKRAIVTKTASAFNVCPVKTNVTKQTNKMIREATKYIDKLIALRKQALRMRSTSNLLNESNLESIFQLF